MYPPDFLTPEETKALDSLVELQIDTWIEDKHIHEVVAGPDVDDDDPTDGDLRTVVR